MGSCLVSDGRGDGLFYTLYAYQSEAERPRQLALRLGASETCFSFLKEG